MLSSQSQPVPFSKLLYLRLRPHLIQLRIRCDLERWNANKRVPFVLITKHFEGFYGNRNGVAACRNEKAFFILHYWPEPFCAPVELGCGAGCAGCCPPPPSP